MTIGGWVLVAFGWLIVIGFAIALCIGIYALGRWYYTSTASGIRAMTDQHSELSNGIERTVTVYTGTGGVIAQYKGKIDIEMDEDYVKFDWNGKRYIYYNCFVETIADIP